MRVTPNMEVPEYEIDPSELDFTNSVDITKVTLQNPSLFIFCNLFLMAKLGVVSVP